MGVSKEGGGNEAPSLERVSERSILECGICFVLQKSRMEPSRDCLGSSTLTVDG